MNTIRKSSMTVIAVAILIGTSGCSGMTAREKSTAVGAGVGAAAGAVITGGALGTAAGAAVGGVIGNQLGKDKK